MFDNVASGDVDSGKLNPKQSERLAASNKVQSHYDLDLCRVSKRPGDRPFWSSPVQHLREELTWNWLH